jgi:uncharacterized protein YdaU (DUF1376 family)
MSLAEEGAYRRLLDHQWLHGSIPGEVGQLAKICKNVSAREMRKMWGTIEPLFQRMPGQPPRLRNGKLERVRADREAFIKHQRQSGSAGGKKRWEKERERLASEQPDSNPTSDPIATLEATPVANGYPAVCSLPSASAEITTTTATPSADAAESGDRRELPHGHSSCMRLVVDRLYLGHRPSERDMAQNGSILKLYGNRHGYDRMARVIEGLALRRDRGELYGVRSNQVVSLKWIHTSKIDINQLAVSEDALYQGSARHGKARVGWLTQAPSRPASSDGSAHDR